MATSRREKIKSAGALGAELSAHLDPPNGKPRAYALFAHCGTCAKDGFAHPDASFNVTEPLDAAGWLRTIRCAPAHAIGHRPDGTVVLALHAPTDTVGDTYRALPIFEHAGEDALGDA